MTPTSSYNHNDDLRFADPFDVEPTPAPVLPQKKPRKPDRRRALTRRAILNAAAELFAKQGVEPTTVDEIAEATGLSVGTLYFHFGSKEGVLLALVGGVLKTAEERLFNARASVSPLERLMQSGELYFRFAVEQPVAFRFVADGIPTLSPDASDDATAAHAAIAERMDAFVSVIRMDLQHAIDAGEIDAIDPEEGLTFIWGAWNGVAGLVLRDDQFAVTAEVADRAIALGRSVLIRGLGGTAPGDAADAGAAVDAAAPADDAPAA
jgi:AcrR family transcriptional regulator